MIEQTNQTTKRQTPTKPLTPSTIVLIRVLFDVILVVISIASLFPAAPEQNLVIGVEARVLYTLVNLLILASSVGAFWLIRQGKPQTAINLLIYGLIFGMFINTIYVDGVAYYSLATTIIFTALGLSQGVEFKKGIFPMVAAAGFGTAGLVFDTWFADSAFRSAPVFGTAAVWIPTAIFGVVALYVIGKQFQSFSLRTKLIISFVVVTGFSLALLGILNLLSFQQMLIGDADKTNNPAFMFIVAGLFAAGIGLFFTQAITGPISQLTNTASKISQGDFSSRVEVNGTDEIGALGNTLNMMAIQLQSLFENLESQVADHTRHLENQTSRLKATAEIARDVTSEEELQYLLDRTTHLLYDRFGFYHVGIYLIDSSSQYAVLSSSQDPQGIQLIANDHRYLIDKNSNVGSACVDRQPKAISSDNPTDEKIYHPLLPNSMAQLTLPLLVSGKTIGAIDIHSTNSQGFTGDEIDTFSTFADQIAIAIEKIEYLQEIQVALKELEAAYGEFTQESWRRFVQGKRDRFTGFKFNQQAIEALVNRPQEVLTAWQAGKPVTTRQDQDGTSKMLIPMKVRGQVIGVLDVQFETEFIPPDTQNLMAEIADRLGLVLENARLIETAQQQVEQEQLAAYLTNQIRQSLDLDTVLRTATQEIGKSLGLAEVEVRLGSIENRSTKANGNPQNLPAPGMGTPGNPENYSPKLNEDEYGPIS